MVASYSLNSPGEIDRGEGGFFGRQEKIVDERCLKLRDPYRDDIAAAARNHAGHGRADQHLCRSGRAPEISFLGIVLIRRSFMNVPDDQIDAARMDGMTEFAIVRRVMLPAAVPALLAFASFSILARSNDYFWSRMVIAGLRNLFTPPLGLRELTGDADGSFFGPAMATATIIATPHRFISGRATPLCRGEHTVWNELGWEISHPTRRP